MIFSRRSMLVASGAVILLTSSVCGEEGNVYDFSQPAESLKDALRQVTRTGGVDLYASSDDIAGRQAPALHGAYSTKQALDLLLVGSGLTADLSGRRVFIRPIQASSAPTAPSADIVVTGSRIRGAPIASPVIALSQREILDSGKTTLGEAVRDLPQNFSGGQNPGIAGNGSQGTNTNFNSSSTINLRGLGPDATLTLLMEAATNFLNSIQVNDCRMANRLVQVAKGDDNMSGIIEEMTGYKSIKEGFANSYQQSREKIQANNNNPTEDLKDALQNCPAEVTDIFKTGSLLAHAATRVGAGDWADQMRARVGDVYMRWDTNDKVPLFSAIPACPLQDTESSDDFLTGKVQRRALNVPPTPKDCSQDGAKGALELARARMQSISDKIRTRGTLTDDEKQFVANVHTLPVYRLLEWGVREGVPDSVIGDTDDLVATSLAYQMLNDLTRSLDFAIDNATRGATAAGAADATSKTICQTRILSKGIDQLQTLREEVLRQRAQMRQSYLAALSQAQVSASFASLLKSRDADARNQTGAAAGRHP